MVNVAAGGAGDGTILDGANSAIKVTVRDYTSSNPLAVALTDSNGDFASAGAGTQYTEDAAAAADPIGTALNLIRKDTPASEVSLDGDNIAARGNSAGAQYVEVLSGTAKIGGDAANGLDVDVTRLPALVAGSANIGDVDVLTVPAPLSTTGGGTEAAAMRVTIANDSTGVLSIDDGGNIITVDGTVAVTNAGLTELAAAIDTEVQVDIVAALPAGTNAIGKLAANSGVDIGDVDVTSIAAGTNIIGAVIPSGHATAGTGLSTVFDADGDNTAQAIKAGAGRLFFLEVYNPNSADAWIQLFDVATGGVTVGTTTPKLSLYVPPGAMDKMWPLPVHFGTAITYACTTTQTGSGDPTTGLTVNAGYV